MEKVSGRLRKGARQKSPQELHAERVAAEARHQLRSGGTCTLAEVPPQPSLLWLLEDANDYYYRHRGELGKVRVVCHSPGCQTTAVSVQGVQQDFCSVHLRKGADARVKRY